MFDCTSRVQHAKRVCSRDAICDAAASWTFQIFGSRFFVPLIPSQMPVVMPGVPSRSKPAPHLQVKYIFSARKSALLTTKSQVEVIPTCHFTLDVSKAKVYGRDQRLAVFSDQTARHPGERDGQDAAICNTSPSLILAVFSVDE